MIIQAVIWDLGGVLVRTEDYAPRQALAQRYGMTLAEIEEFVFSGESGDRAQRGEISVEQHWENQGRQLGLSPEEIQAFRNEFWAATAWTPTWWRISAGCDWILRPAC